MQRAMQDIEPGSSFSPEVRELKSSLGRKGKLTLLTRKLGLFAIVNIVLINAVLILVFKTAWKETAPHQLTQRFLLVRQGTDSWGLMSEAYLYAQNNPLQPIYSDLFFDKGIKFIYPPSSLLIIALLQKVRNDAGFWLDVFRIISWVFVIIMAIFTLKIFEASLANNGGGNRIAFDTDSFVRTGLVLGLIFTFYPMIRGYSVGQIQVWINSLFAIIFWCWMKDKKGIAGALTGIICLLKPQYSIILGWGIFRQQWTFVLSFAATLLAGLLVSVSVFGVTDHLDYLRVLSFLSKHGDAYYPNQSINGLLNRLFQNGNILVWQGRAWPPFNPWVYGGTLISSIALISMALFWPMKKSEKGSILDFSIVALTCTMASPLAWVHHYGILLPIYAFLLPTLLRRKIFGRITIAYLAISYVLTSNNFAITRALADTPLNIAMSYLLVGGSMVLVCLYLLRNEKQVGSAEQIQSPSRLT
jgi:alpha-1,2-mannosyltransferase